MPQRVHGLAFRVWNQTRLAHHVDSYFQIYDEITAPDAHVPDPYAEPILRMSLALYQTLIVHLDMIKARTGVSLYGLIDEARSSAKIDHGTASRLQGEIDRHGTVLSNICRQRNNLVAHRSPSHTFAEVRAAYPVETQDLRAVVATYYDVATQLYSHVPFQNVWKTKDERTATRSLLQALRSAPERI